MRFDILVQLCSSFNSLRNIIHREWKWWPFGSFNPRRTYLSSHLNQLSPSLTMVNGFGRATAHREWDRSDRAHHLTASWMAMAISVQVPFSFPSTDVVWIHYGIKTARYHLTSCATVVVLIHYGITPVQVPFGIPNTDVVWIHYGINSAMPFDILRNCIVLIRSGILQVQAPYGFLTLY